MVKSLSGKICYSIDRAWQNFRGLFHGNDSLFELLFLLLYFFEQFGFVYATILFRDNLDYLPYIVAFFALVLVTTVGTHRLLMESKNRFVREEYNKLVIGYYKLESSYNLIEIEYKQQNKLLGNIVKDNEILFIENQNLRKKLE